MKGGVGLSLEGWIRLLVVGAGVAVLEAACRFGLVSRTVLIPPSLMATSLVEVLHGGQHNAGILSSFANVAIAAALSVGLGFAAGILIHAWQGLRSALEPLLASYYAVPTFMFYPVFIILFGVGSASIIAIAVLLAIVAMITATLNGLDRIPPVLRKTARIMGMGASRTAILVSLPAALPHLFTGVKLAVAYAFIGVIASEFILSGSGIGYSIAYAYNNFDNREMYALMLLIVIVTTVVNGVLDAIDRRLKARLAR